MKAAYVSTLWITRQLETLAALVQDGEPRIARTFKDDLYQLVLRAIAEDRCGGQPAACAQAVLHAESLMKGE